jgi:riboflavin kinase/FMN adenylyltransferase
MDVQHGLAHSSEDSSGSAVTIGFFDGVHLGHRALLERTVAASHERSLRSVAITFDRHPREILTPGSAPRLLTTLERKTELIARAGIDRLIVLPFTEELSRRSAVWFVDEVLVGEVRAKHMMVGANFTFGHRAQGTVATLEELGPARSFSLETLDLLELDGRPVSSSSIREELAGGSLAWPERALGRRYAVDGRVVRGAGRGAGLGFPTANLRTEPRLLLPGSGIYAGAAAFGEERRVAAISVGTNPQFGSEPLHVEAYVLDFEGDLRDRELTVAFWTRLRDEARFASVEELRHAIAADVKRTREIVRLSPEPAA